MSVLLTWFPRYRQRVWWHCSVLLRRLLDWPRHHPNSGRLRGRVSVLHGDRLLCRVRALHLRLVHLHIPAVDPDSQVNTGFQLAVLHGLDGLYLPWNCVSRCS